MARSLKKGPYIDFRLKKKVDEANDKSSKGVIKTWSKIGRAHVRTPVTS